MEDLKNTEEYKELKELIIERRALLRDEFEVVNRFIELIKFSSNSLYNSTEEFNNQMNKILDYEISAYNSAQKNLEDKMEEFLNAVDTLTGTVNLFSKFLAEKMIEFDNQKGDNL